MKVRQDNDGYIVNAAVLSATEIHQQNVRCPVCAEFPFLRWPSGWDGHANVCKGLRRRILGRAQGGVQTGSRAPVPVRCLEQHGVSPLPARPNPGWPCDPQGAVEAVDFRLPPPHLRGRDPCK